MSICVPQIALQLKIIHVTHIDYEIPGKGLHVKYHEFTH